MFALTSLSNKRHEHQQKCINTWVKEGFKPIAFINGELDYQYENIEVIHTDNVRSFGNNFVALDNFFDFIRQSNENCVIINSDIEIIDFPEYIEKEMDKGIIVSNRFNYDEDIKLNKKWEQGFDAFFISPKFVDIFQESDFVLGQCHYDYWIPYKAIKNRIPLMITKDKFMFHEFHGHSKAYKQGFWKQTALHFIELERMNYTKNETGCWQLNKEVWKEIQNNFEWI